ncbi:sterile alpha motif domain-containing protein 9-like [Pseudoliparis swirei]|uniref:sterile alpha motif domain-containing protein 9-like n=1 Tax=Pseudoliparis swirei TaxID=2059687 RepID=UPI0024BEA7E2|nr:sterile alpha motif domain-containing protein 9-like [Pseudoliparis swirei]XP_056291420.1 sterile alpha motif domain-containing protein 9-like [Pseudoliparis swirei]
MESPAERTMPVSWNPQEEDVVPSNRSKIPSKRASYLGSSEEIKCQEDVPGGACKPYPFDRYDATYRYIEGDILDVTESGASDLIEPCHEYKAFNNTLDGPTMTRSGEEVIRFAAACMNSCTNGTIHFGIGDELNFKHGQVLGVVVQDREAYAKKIHSALDHFEQKHRTIARHCIRPPRFVGVLNRNDTLSERYVIEVDIVPDSTMCGDNIFHTFNLKKGKKKGEKKIFFRDGGSSRDLLAPTTSAKPMVEYNQFVADKPQLVQLRKQAEEKHNVMTTEGRLASETPRLEEITSQVHKKRSRSLVIESKGISYFADTSEQNLKHEFKNAIANYKEEPVSPERLETFLKMARSPFQETQSLAKKESSQRVWPFKILKQFKEVL